MDAATKSIEAIREGVKRGEYVEIKGVPLFPVHDEYDMRRVSDGKPNPNFGKVKERFDKTRLEKIASKCNERAMKSGDLAPFGPGHTIPGANVPETQQPPVYGFFADYEVGEFGPGKETGILATAYARKEHEADVKQGFPRRSIELVPGEEFIDWVALLRRAPAMDIGILAYQRECPWVDQENYQPVFGPGGVPLAGCYSQDGKLRYSLDHQETKMDTLPAVPAEQKALFDNLIRYMREQGVVAPEKAPGPVKKPEGAPVGPPEDEKVRMQREQEAIRYARIETELTAVKEELTKERYQRTQAECERQVIQLEGEGFQLDRAAEVSRMVPLDDAGRKAHVETIKRFYRQAPVGEQSWIKTVGAEKGDDLYAGLPRERFDAAQRYMREQTNQGRPCTWTEAVTKVSAN